MPLSWQVPLEGATLQIPLPPDYETSEEMDELREIKKRLSLEYLAMTPEEWIKRSEERVARLRVELQLDEHDCHHPAYSIR